MPTESEYTNEWYRTQFRALAFRLTKIEGLNVDLMHDITMYRKQVGELQSDRERDAAKIGQLMSEKEELAGRVTAMEKQLTEITTRLERQGEFLGQLKKGK